MKNKHLLILFFLTMILVVIGALFKIMHWTYAGITGNALLSIGLVSEAIVIVLLILKITKDNKSDFLNK
ncbi:gliding motility protein GldL [Flavobacterium sp.]|uniref:GldL-related protein n=1 Tax=Flavobacterium sp. TaxID=239 RepID=UPI0037BFD22A